MPELCGMDEKCLGEKGQREVVGLGMRVQGTHWCLLVVERKPGSSRRCGQKARQQPTSRRIL